MLTTEYIEVKQCRKNRYILFISVLLICAIVFYAFQEHHLPASTAGFFAGILFIDLTLYPSRYRFTPNSDGLLYQHWRQSETAPDKEIRLSTQYIICFLEKKALLGGSHLYAVDNTNHRFTLAKHIHITDELHNALTAIAPIKPISK